MMLEYSLVPIHMELQDRRGIPSSLMRNRILWGVRRWASWMPLSPTPVAGRRADLPWRLVSLCLVFTSKFTFFFYNALNPLLWVFSCHGIGVTQSPRDLDHLRLFLLSSGRVTLRPPFLTGKENKILSVVVSVFFRVGDGIKFSLISFSGSCGYSSMSGVVRVKKDNLVCIPLVYAWYTFWGAVEGVLSEFGNGFCVLWHYFCFEIMTGRSAADDRSEYSMAFQNVNIFILENLLGVFEVILFRYYVA